MQEYVELLVKRAPVKGAELLKKLVGGLGILLLLMGFAFGNLLFLILAVAAGLVYYFKILRMNVEYEYFFGDGEFEITQIYNESKRKKFMTLTESMIELVAAADADEVDYYGHAKEVDCSANDPENPPYVIVCNADGAKKKVLIQMNEELLRAMKRQMPSKVRLY